MDHPRKVPRPVLVGGALLFAAATLTYSILWMAAVRWSPGGPLVELGYESDYLPAFQSQLVRIVHPESPAERAGLRSGDRILAIDGEPLEDEGLQIRVWLQHKPGDMVNLTVQHYGQTAPVVLIGVFRQRRLLSREVPVSEAIANQFRGSFPVPFVVVGLAILFLRLEDARVWILALLFASFAVTPGIQEQMAAMAPRLRGFSLAYRAVFIALLGPLFYWFSAVFPARPAIDRRLPWLKWAAVGTGIGLALPGLDMGSAALPGWLARRLGPEVSRGIALSFTYAWLVLGLYTLAAAYFRSPSAEAKRKIRVMFWGTVTGLTPVVALQAAADFGGLQSSLWLDTAKVALLFLLPLSFGYAVIKHRVLEIPVLLKRSARYLLVQRGFTILLSLLSIGLLLLFAVEFARRPAQAAQPVAIAFGAVFGTALMWGGSQVHRRVSGRIDRAFFRSAYDARRILEDLAEKTRSATDQTALAELLQRQVSEALQPAWMVMYLAGGRGLVPVTGRAAGDLPPIPAKLPLLVELGRRGQPWELPIEGPEAASAAAFGPRFPECLAPMVGRRGLVGVLALGPRLSEEPYSREDMRLLASVASQAGTAFENIRLAEEIAERMEAERRAALEMEIAREVQGRLLPQSAPALGTLECAAQCIQARSVGGDYYDFLRLDADRLGLVLADVSGKGVHAALLMANLQAHLRGQSAAGNADPVPLLETVNRLLWESTSAQHYATLFYGVYDDRSGSFIYANCGHNPAILLRAGGGVERLSATATVIGMFERWKCAACEVRLGPGDLLAIYSDGVTEAARNEEEFGETRLIEELRTGRDRPVDQIVAGILKIVLEFSPGMQADDLTLLLARVRPRA